MEKETFLKMEKEKKKVLRSFLTLQQRIEVINCSTSGLSQRQLAEKFCCGKSQIQSILSNKKALLKEWAESGERASKRRKSSTYEDVNKLVWEWFQKASQKHLPLSGASLQEKAREYAEFLNISGFTASNGWLERFKKRHNIDFRKANRERGLNIPKNVEEWKLTFTQIIESYAVEDIYNLDEAGLFFKAIPDKTLIEKGEKYSEGKLSELITIALCCNALGDKEKPLVITKSKWSGYVEDIDLSQLGIIHKVNRNAWMTPSLFQEWLENLNGKMKSNNRNILLIIDNASYHPKYLKLSNIKLLFLPTDFAAVLQPFEQGIIKAFKISYRKQFLRMLIARMETSDVVSNVAKHVTMLDAIRLIKNAWSDVKIETIQKCFHVCGLSNLKFEQDINIHEHDEELQELKKLCNAIQITDCVYDENIQFYEDLPYDWEYHIKQDYVAKNIMQVEFERESVEEEEEKNPITPFSPSEALHAISRLKETFKQLDFAKCEEKLVYLENQLEDHIVKKKLKLR